MSRIVRMCAHSKNRSFMSPTRQRCCKTQAALLYVTMVLARRIDAANQELSN